MRDGLKLNLGCGTDIRPGWVNIDYMASFGAGLECVGAECWQMDMADLSEMRPGRVLYDGCADLILVNHSLHQLTYDAADRALAEMVRVLGPLGRLVIVDADVIGLLGDYGGGFSSSGGVGMVPGLIGDDAEPTNDGKMLRWASWFGERRSLWSAGMLCDRLRRLGLDASDYDPWADQYAEFVGNRAAESFLVVASK